MVWSLVKVSEDPRQLSIVNLACAVHLTCFLNGKYLFYSSAFLMICTVAFKNQIIFYDLF